MCDGCVLCVCVLGLWLLVCGVCGCWLVWCFCLFAVFFCGVHVLRRAGARCAVDGAVRCAASMGRRRRVARRTTSCVRRGRGGGLGRSRLQRVSAEFGASWDWLCLREARRGCGGGWRGLWSGCVGGMVGECFEVAVGDVSAARAAFWCWCDWCVTGGGVFVGVTCM